MDSKSNKSDRSEWVELWEPCSKKIIFANLESGEVRWDSPSDARVRPLASEQWWELFDVNTQRHYYHNVRSGKTEWNRPPKGDVIPLSNLQLIKQFASATGDHGAMDNSGNNSNTKTLDIGMMHRYKNSTCVVGGISARNSIHTPSINTGGSGVASSTPQDHRKFSSSTTTNMGSHHSGGGPLLSGPSPVRPSSYHHHRRRNSQPTSAGGESGQEPPLAVTTNQRVTEWLRTAGSVPEEEADSAGGEGEDKMVAGMHFQHQKVYPPVAGPLPQSPHPRWSTTTRGNSHHSNGSSTTAAVAAAAAFRSPGAPVSAVASSVDSSTPYDRRVVSMVPPPPPPPPLHQTLHPQPQSENAFANLLYDMSCNMVASPNTAATSNLVSNIAGLVLSPPARSVPRTNPHATGTMPRLPSAATAAQKAVRNGNGKDSGNGVRRRKITSSSPDTEVTTNSGGSVSYSGDSEPEEKEPNQQQQRQQTSPVAVSVAPVTRKDSSASNYSKEDIFEQHPFRLASVMPVDEYTFTVPRQQQPLSQHHHHHPSNQSAHFHHPQAGPPLPPQVATHLHPQQFLAGFHPTNDNSSSNWAAGYLAQQQQRQHMIVAAAPMGMLEETDQPPPTPPPRLASAINTMQLSRTPRSVGAALENSSWQNFEGASGSGSGGSAFLVRNHPFRQPLKQASSYTNPALYTVTSTEDEVCDDPGLTHTSTRSLLSAASSSVAGVGGQDNTTPATNAVAPATNVGTTSSAGAASAASGFFFPRRSASGGFIGPAEPASSDLPPPPAPSGCAIACSGSTHFALISGPHAWPKNLLRLPAGGGGQQEALMSWTKAAFSKRLLAATDKSLQKHIPENFKLIQSFMGDRSAKLSKPDLASIIVQRALTTPGVRDELYAQLCKQTTGNYNADSLMRGWELICICLYYFPPNKVFRDPLQAYLACRSEALSITAANHSSSSASSSSLTKNASATPLNRPGPSLAAAAALAAGSDPAGFIATQVTPSFGVPMADEDPHADVAEAGAVGSEFPYGPWVKLSALHFTRAAPRWFMRSVAIGGAAAGSRGVVVAPSKEELLHVKDFLLKPGVFGSSLEEMMKIQVCRFPTLRLPWIQVFLTEELLRLNGAKAEGIFRVSADQDVLTSVRFQLEKLFEVFRLLEVVTTRDAPPTFSIVRPPPPGWSNSQFVFSPEPQTTTIKTIDRPPLLPCASLTGSFALPLLPTPIPTRPTEYMLLTPRSLWPGDLAAFAENSTGGEKGSFQDPHLAAALLKLWLREMATPLVPPAMASEVLSAAMEAEAVEKSGSGGGEGKEAIERCCAMVRRLPKINRRVLLYLIKLCQHLALLENSGVSLMDARNLATVIAPNLFRSTSNNPSEMLNSVQSQTAFTRLLITHLDVDREAALLDGHPDTPGAVSSVQRSPDFPESFHASSSVNSLLQSVSATRC